MSSAQIILLYFTCTTSILLLFIANRFFYRILFN